jgi:hypothetical protein
MNNRNGWNHGQTDTVHRVLISDDTVTNMPTHEPRNDDYSTRPRGAPKEDRTAPSTPQSSHLNPIYCIQMLRCTRTAATPPPCAPPLLPCPHALVALGSRTPTPRGPLHREDPCPALSTIRHLGVKRWRRFLPLCTCLRRRLTNCYVGRKIGAPREGLECVISPGG